MATKPKNYYMTRLPDGKEQVYQSPDALLAKGYAYFAWCDKTPWNKSELAKSGDRKGEAVNIALGRPYTLAGLCVYCGISPQKLDEYEANNLFAPAVQQLRIIINQHLIEGASIGIYNANLVIRLLGLTDKQELADQRAKVLVVNSTNPQAQEMIEQLKQKLSGKN